MSPTALGIGAASFASGTGNGIRERGMGFGNENWERELGAGRNEASKDIAESPAAIAERPK